MPGFARPVPRGGYEGTPKSFFHYDDCPTAGVRTKIIDVTVPDDTRYDAHQLSLVCSQPANIELFVNGKDTGAGKSGPGETNVFIPVFPPESAAASQKIEIYFTLTPGFPRVPIKAHLRCSEVSV